jgi:prepilin peptidase CpaA
MPLRRLADAHAPSDRRTQRVIQNRPRMDAILNSTALALLATVLCLAVYTDLRRNRIPNVLSGSALLAGILLHATVSGWTGFLEALAGAALALGMLLPFYLGRGIAAGDVKLMAGAGALLGAPAAFAATLATLIAGAMLALVFVTWRSWRPYAGHHSLMFLHVAMWRGTFASLRKERFPYAAAIATGTLFALWRCDGRILLP